MRLKFGNPAAIYLVGDGELPSLVVELDDDVFAEILERDFRAKTRAKIPHFIRPLLELLIVSHAALERNRLVLGAARRFAAGAGVTAFAMLDHFSGALQRADLAYAGHIFAIPLDAEFEVLVWIEALWVNLNCAMVFSPA